MLLRRGRPSRSIQAGSALAVQVVQCDSRPRLTRQPAFGRPPAHAAARWPPPAAAGGRATRRPASTSSRRGRGNRSAPRGGRPVPRGFGRPGSPAAGKVTPATLAAATLGVPAPGDHQREQVFPRVGLAEVVVDAQLGRVVAVLLRDARGDHDHRQVAQPGGSPRCCAPGRKPSMRGISMSDSTTCGSSARRSRRPAVLRR